MYHYHIDDFFKKGKSVVMTESVFVPNSLVDHCHEYLEIAYIKDGVGEHILNGKRHAVKRGDVFFIGKNSVHNYNAVSSNFNWINCMFLPTALSADAFTCNNAKDIVKLAVFANISEIQKITAESIELQMKIDEFGALFTEMLREYNEDRSGSQEIQALPLHSLHQALPPVYYHQRTKEKGRKDRLREDRDRLFGEEFL